MHEVTIRELRNEGGRILERVVQGEVLTVTRNGRPVAEIRPLPRRPVRSAALLDRWRRLPAVDTQTLAADIDSILDPAL